jgi:PAS domain S-box-containing protein
MKQPLARRLTLGMGLALAVLAVLGAYSWLSSTRLASRGQDLQRAQQVLTLLANMQASVAEAESAQRAFSLVADAAAADRQAKAKLATDAKMAELRNLSAGSPEQYVRLVALGPLLAKRFEVMAAAMDLRRRAGAAPAMQLEASGEGTRWQERIQLALAELQRHGEADLATERRRIEAAASLSGGLVVLSCALALLVAGAALWRVRRDLLQQRFVEAEKARATRKQRQSASEHDRVFETAVDVLCTLDAEGRFVRLSTGCARLWGWSAEELQGTPYINKVQPEDRRKTERTLAAVVAGQPCTDMPTRWQCKDGSLLQLVWNAQWSATDNTLLCSARDITELQRLRDAAARLTIALRQGSTALAEATQRADAALQSQSGFLAVMGQHLRTPLNDITSTADTLAQALAEGGPVEVRRSAQALRERAHRVQDTVRDMLDLAALEAGQLTLHRDAFDLAETLQQVTTAVRPLADKKGLQLQVQLADDLGYARGDAQRVAQVLTKLLRHAVDLSPAGMVQLRAARVGSTAADSALRIEVADASGGMPVAQLATLFDPWQADAPGGGAGAVGSGLKLAVPRKLARLMGGDILATSEPNVGCTFTLTLPSDTLEH